MKLKKKSILKTATVSFVALFLLASLVGCSEDDNNGEASNESSSTVSSTKKSTQATSSSEPTEISDSVSQEAQDKYTKLAEDDFDLIKEGNFQELQKQFDSTVKNELTEEKFNEITAVLKKGGEFEGFGKTIVKMSGDIYMASIILNYSNTTFDLVMEFNANNDEISALYIQ